MAEEVKTEAPVEAQEPTLESVYQEFKVEPQQQQPQQQVAPQQQPQQPDVSVPDPTLDPEGYKRFAAGNVRDTQEIKHALRTVVQHLTAAEVMRTRNEEEADIRKAVDVVNSSLKADPDFAEIAIAQRAKRDPKFMSLWQNRKSNPQALEKGLKALGAELSKKFEFRADPQLAENQRAMKEVTQTKAVGNPPDTLEQQLGKLTGRDFDDAIARIRNTGY